MKKSKHAGRYKVTLGGFTYWVAKQVKPKKIKVQVGGRRVSSREAALNRILFALEKQYEIKIKKARLAVDIAREKAIKKYERGSE